MPTYALARAVTCLILGFAAALPAAAAEFTKRPPQNGKPDLIAVVGDLELGDEDKFADAARYSSDAMVLFQSRGGNLIAAIEIGRTIRRKGFSTLVPDKMQCASACALAWLGGRTRYMSASAHVGFHAVYTDKSGRPMVSSAGNALVGAYLNELGLSSSAIIYITSAAPTQMQWLSLADAQQAGIDVKLLSQSLAKTTSSKSGQSQGSGDKSGGESGDKSLDESLENRSQ
jgi:hypothetical protein